MYNVILFVIQISVQFHMKNFYNKEKQDNYNKKDKAENRSRGAAQKGKHMAKIDNTAIMQIALIVKDIEKVAANYALAFDIPMPEIQQVPDVREVSIFYRGKRTDSRAKICCFQMGSIILELTEPDETDSGWKEFYDLHGQGVHHIGIQVNDRDEAMEALAEFGVEVNHVGYYPTGSYTFMDSMEQFGVNFNIKHGGEDNSDKLLK